MEQVSIELWSEYSGWEMPAVKLVAMLQRIIAEQPAEYRDQVMFEVEVESDYYGGSSTSTIVRYQRPISDEEIAAREAENARSMAHYRDVNERRERAILAQLKAKYGD